MISIQKMALLLGFNYDLDLLESNVSLWSFVLSKPTGGCGSLATACSGRMDEWIHSALGGSTLCSQPCSGTLGHTLDQIDAPGSSPLGFHTRAQLIDAGRWGGGCAWRAVHPSIGCACRALQT